MGVERSYTVHVTKISLYSIIRMRGSRDVSSKLLKEKVDGGGQ